MKSSPYLFFNGNCAEALKFYEQTIGAKITSVMTNAQTPMKDHFPPESLDKIIHARIAIGDTVVMASDCPPDRYEKQAGFTIAVMVDSSEEAEAKFTALMEGGIIGAPMEETFFATRFGMGTDRFGIPWMVLCEKAPM